jgi:transposase
MAPHLSREMRERIIVWHYELHKSPPEIAQLASCSVRTVYNVLSLHRDFDTVDNPFAQPCGRSRALDTGDMTYIASLLDARPKMYLDELQSELALHRDLDVSLTTISRALRRLAINHKKVAAEAAERNELLRATWIAQNGDIPAEYFVWLDEAAVDDCTNQRTHGWAAMGQSCVCRETFIRGQRYSVLPALSADGIIALDIFEGSVNKERFVKFVEEQVVSTSGLQTLLSLFSVVCRLRS